LYFVAPGATVTLPPATTAGQQLILYDSTLDPASGATYHVSPAGGDLLIDGPGSTAYSSAESDLFYDEAQVVSDGNGHWFVLNRN
jgi:hypothetical protein